MGSYTPAPKIALSPGDRLDRYELLCILAQGGMGAVWLARMTGKHGFERLVALKTILPTYGNDRQFCDMFLDEARIAARIDHENVARILDIGEDHGVLYHAMELVDGESLRKLYRDVRQVGAPFPLAVALRIAADTCAGLHAVHELRGPDGVPLDVVHRDVSPQNILITARGGIKLIDFGVAKARERRTEETTAGTLKGKIEYMAPEQAKGDRLDRRADLYAVGAVLYELLAGRPVRKTEDGRQLRALHELMTGVPYEPLHSSIPLPVRSVVDRALSLDPELRYPTAEDMRHALEQAMISIQHGATSDDVANVLTHFSRERANQRKEKIDAALRAARALEQGQGRSGVDRGGLPLVAPPGQSSPSMLPAGGSQGTQVMDVSGILVTEGASTGPSMRTMQGSSISAPRPAPTTSSAAKVFAAVAVLGLVAVLGVIAGIVVSRNGLAPAAPSTAPEAKAVAVEAGDAGVKATSGDAPAVASEPSVPTIGAVAVDSGVVTSAGASPIATPKKVIKGGARPAGHKSDLGDDYGF